MNSETWRSRAEAVIPGGVSSNVRLSAPRTCFTRGSGARLFDVDGREYVDYLLGQGPAFLGHGHPEVTAAVAEATSRGMVFGAQHTLEIEAAEALVEAIGWAEQVRFGVSGTESDQGALRLARAATGRRRVLRFSGTYHGWLDNVLIDFQAGPTSPASEGQSEASLSEWIVVPFNDRTAVENAFAEHGEHIAAVIVEPVMCNNGVIRAAPGFLELLRSLCTRNGSLLIFDEVITGFRLARGGAAEFFGVTPDLAVYGKAVAGGWPVSAMAGSKELMDLIASGRVNHSGTFNASTMAAAAVLATQKVLREQPPYDGIAAHSATLTTGLAEIAERHGLPLAIQGVNAAFHLGIPKDPASASPATCYEELAGLDLARYARLSHRFAEEGLWVAGRGVWYISAAHNASDAEKALEAFEAVVSKDAA
ncbi:aspartate aminotransferase family protein [Sinomonas sp. JGH33]|uniref:Aspartate aminotransferase family protein n=1 Tax=Sinomonas terricola TaxID=3110330 RepID=A0ABU5TC85_9MICC|nr:aspartate aminotransferase family protein [Sinomonas sp. JGH33]MEA5457270.1 aspartate aminotransferase family protein [Sinomonas sp. JGH33]